MDPAPFKWWAQPCGNLYMCRYENMASVCIYPVMQASVCGLPYRSNTAHSHRGGSDNSKN